MSIAGPTIVVLCLLLPGMAFRRFYYSGAFSKQYASEDFGRLLLRTVLIAVVIHAVAGAAASAVAPELLTGYTIAIEGAFGSGTEGLVRGFGRWPRSTVFAWGYAAVVLLGAVSGYVAQFAIPRLRLDRRYKLLRYRNYWHYLLRGGIREFGGVGPLLSTGRGEVAYTYVDVVVGGDGGDVLYNGVLVDYELARGGELDTLVLTNVSRRAMREDYVRGTDDPTGGTRDDRGRGARFYGVIGDLVVVPAREIKNYNLRYVTLFDVAAAADGQLTVSVTDADGDVTTAAYYDAPDA